MIEKMLQPQKEYHVMVESPNGEASRTTVSMPGLTELLIEPNENVHCEQQIEFTYENVEHPEHIQMEVGFFHGDEIKWSEVNFVDQLKHRENSDEMFVSLSPRNLLVEVFPPPNIISSVDRRTLMPTVNCNGLNSANVHVRYIHFGKEWELFSPGFFPINPLEWQDVENGLGFLGAFREDSTAFTIHLPTD